MEIEVKRAARTWFCTFTFRPEARQRMSLAYGGDQKALVTAARREFSAYVKRVREGQRPRRKFRYVVVVELHKDGFPHLHALIHEREGVPLPKRLLESKWLLGYSKVKLVEEGDKAAEYVSKYVSKSGAKVIASILYGKDTPESKELASRLVPVGTSEDSSSPCGKSSPAPLTSLPLVFRPQREQMGSPANNNGNDKDKI